MGSFAIAVEAASSVLFSVFVHCPLLS